MNRSVEEIERLAMAGCEVPGDYTQPEQLLFLSLRVLHWEYRHSVIDRVQAKDEKVKLVQAYEAETRMHDIFRQHVRIQNTMSHKLTEAKKHGCPICREIVKIFDGRKEV